MLRHLAGFLAGLALAPLLWGALSWSAGLLPRLAEGEASTPTVSAAVLLILVGLCGAGLVATRLSPVIACTCGLLLAAVALWPMVSPESMASVLGWLNSEHFLYPAGHGLALALPLGFLLFGSALPPTRWRALHGMPGGARTVAGMSREQYRPAPMERAEDPDPDGHGPSGDTVPDPPSAPVGQTPPLVNDPGIDPDRTTTPFRRGENGAVWTPLDDETAQNPAYRDDRV